MIKDVAEAQRFMPLWDEHQKGLETLATTIGPSKTINVETRKALTVGDLLVKVCELMHQFAALSYLLCSIAGPTDM